MSKRPSTFRKTDIKRLVEAAAMAGLEVGTIEVTKAGDLRFTPRSTSAPVERDFRGGADGEQAAP